MIKVIDSAGLISDPYTAELGMPIMLLKMIPARMVISLSAGADLLTRVYVPRLREIVAISRGQSHDNSSDTGWSYVGDSTNANNLNATAISPKQNNWLPLI